MASTWIVLNAGGTGGGTALPGQPSITAVRYRYLPQDADGRVYVEAIVTVTPPSPLGTYAGCNLWLQAPDAFGVDDFGGGGLELGADEIGAAFAPQFLTWVASGEEGRFRFPAPDLTQWWRLYGVAGNEDKERRPVQKGLSGESPSYAFAVDPPPATALGREYAPVVRDLVVNLRRDETGSDSGEQRYRLEIDWAWPVDDEAFNTLAGVDVRLNDGDDTTEDLRASKSVEYGQAADSFITEWAEVPASPTRYRIELYSYDTSGRRNSYQRGVTPTFDIVVSRQNGSAGREYSPVVTLSGSGVTATTYGAADGTEMIQLRTDWIAPSDSRFGGIEIVVERPDGQRRVVVGGRLAPTESHIPAPPATENWKVWLVSLDAAAGRRNTIVDGVTPYQVVSVGTAAGRLNIAKAYNFASGRFQTSGGVFDIKVDSISTAYLAAAGIDVGGGGSKPIRFRVFDGAGSLIGWIGDDTANSGYVGAWFKQVRLGGTSPANSPIQTDSGGNTTINGATFTLDLNSVVVRIANETSAGSTAGLFVRDNPETLRTNVRPGTVDITVAAGLAVFLNGSSGNGQLRLYNSGTEGASLSASSGLRVGGGASTAPFRVGVDGIVQFYTGTYTSGTITPPSAAEGFITMQINGVNKKVFYYG